MYDLEGADSGREWIEVYNDTGAAIDLTKYKLLENNVAHGIAHVEGSDNLPAGKYAIIADNPANFLIDNSAFNKAQLYDSSFSFSNSGETLALKDADGAILFEINYDVTLGAGGDGKTLQRKTDGSWFAASGTPGSSPVMSLSDNEESDGEDVPGASNETTGTIISENRKVDNSSLRFSFSIPTTAIAGMPVSMTASVFGSSGEPITGGKFLWNFGDGATEASNFNLPAEHIYIFPGTYVVSYVYRFNAYSKPAGTGKTTITIVESPVEIAGFHEAPFPALRLRNKRNAEYDISGYIVSTGTASVVLPEGTYIGPKNEITVLLPPGMHDAAKIALLHPSGYASASLAKAEPKKEAAAVVAAAAVALAPNETFGNAPLPPPVLINLDPAARSVPEGKKKSWYLMLGASIALAAGALYAISRSRSQPSTLLEDEYALQDE